MIRQYQIAGVVIRVETEEQLLDAENFALYRVEETEAGSLLQEPYRIRLLCEEVLPEKLDLGEEVFRNELNRVGRTAEGYVHSFYRPCTDQLLAWNPVTETDTLELHYLRSAEAYFSLSTHVFNAASIERILHRRQRYIFHCSYVDWEGRGILFSAPSGGGKTTQGLLWEQYAGAEMLNGDRCVLERTEGGYLCHGLPIAGSSGVFTNRTRPLSCIFRVQKAGRNSVRRLTQLEAFHAVFTELTVNGWDPVFRLDAVDFAMELASRVPVYLLECKIDAEAVRVAQAVLGDC